MKTFKHKKTAVALLSMAITAGLSGMAIAAPVSGVASTPISNKLVTPYIIAGKNKGGNRTCDEVGAAYGVIYQCQSAKINNENSSLVGSGFPFPSANNTDEDITNDNPDCGEVTVTNSDGIYVSWEGNPAAGFGPHDGLAAIVKGSSDANTYVYLDDSVDSDSGLASPVNNSEDSAGLSNLTFCWNPGSLLPDPDLPEACYTGETAWSGGNRYVKKGNWATYTAYSGNEYTVSLNAGQILPAGNVTFSTPSNGNITITVTLNTGWRFQPPKEDETSIDNVKIQDYTATPAAKNPAPGSFAHKTFGQGSTATIEVPENKFYGVHVDVEREIPCPVAD